MDYVAKYFEKLDNNKVKCFLCRHNCTISESHLGICGVRKNIKGDLISLVYGRPKSYGIDPIEKKPLFNFYPGSRAFSLCTVGCNFRCLHCQNWTISQSRDYGKHYIEPEEMLVTALAQKADGFSYTYTEPTVFYEYAYDIAKLASKKGMYNMFVTNGYISEEALRDISKYLDAANIDVKGFNDEFYRKVCGAKLERVIESVKLYFELGIHIELTYLMIPTHNVDMEQVTLFIKWVKEELNEDIPIHFSRFHPDYKLQNIEPTDPKMLEKARECALNFGMKYVYLGNIRIYEDTFCPNCKKVLIKRHGFFVSDYIITKDKKCPNCGEKINIVGEFRG